MEMSSKEIRAKIRSLKSELSQTKSYYFNKINPLRQREIQLRNRPLAVGLLTQKLIAKQEQKLEGIRNELKELEKERDEKIGKLENELKSLKNTYRKNYDKYKAEDKKARKEKIDDAKIFFDHYKYAFIGLAVFFVIIILISIISAVSKNSEIANERNRNYYIKIDEQFTFDCNAYINDSWIICESRSLTGEFSNYDTVEFNWKLDLTTNGDSFTQVINDRVDGTSYRKADFNIDDLRNGMDRLHSVDLKNTVLDEIVANKNIMVHYNFTDADLDIISQMHDKWVAEEAEKAAKAQQEKEEKEKKEAEEKARKEEEERAATEEAERKAQEEAEKETTESGNNPDQIPKNEVYTGIAACQRVAKNNYGLKLRTTEFANGYTGNEDYAWMFVFRGSNYNMVTCQYHWKTGYAEIMYVDL